MTLDLLEKLTLSPGEVGTEDVDRLRRVGLMDEDIEDAIVICGLFNIINRISDALGFEVPAVDGPARWTAP